MTAKEKAEEMFINFSDIEHLGVYGSYNGTWEWSSSLWRQQAKECSLIAVDTILNLCWGGNKIGKDYWNEVKQEIENL